MSFMLSGDRGPAGVGRRVALRSAATFFSSLSHFCRLLDARQLVANLSPSAPAAVLMSVKYFALPHTLDRISSFSPVCGGTWGQGLEALLELATRASSWAEARGIDPHDEQLVQVWTEAIGLAWAAELVARCHLTPAPYLAWEAGMLLAATAVGEQLRLLDIDAHADQVKLCHANIRQIEGLVIQEEFPASLSLSMAVRRASYLGPWPSVSLAYRVSQRQARFEWAEGVLDQVEALPTTPVVQQCVMQQLSKQWLEVMEISRRAWLAGLAAARRERAN